MKIGGDADRSGTHARSDGVRCPEPAKEFDPGARRHHRLLPPARAEHVLTRHTTYQDLGHNYFDERDREGVKRRALRRSQQLGYQVTLSHPVTAVA